MGAIFAMRWRGVVSGAAAVFVLLALVFVHHSSKRASLTLGSLQEVLLVQEQVEDLANVIDTYSVAHDPYPLGANDVPLLVGDVIKEGVVAVAREALASSCSLHLAAVSDVPAALVQQTVVSKAMLYTVVFRVPSRGSTLRVYVLDGRRWTPALPADAVGGAVPVHTLRVVQVDPSTCDEGPGATTPRHPQLGLVSHGSPRRHAHDGRRITAPRHHILPPSVLASAVDTHLERIEQDMPTLYDVRDVGSGVSPCKAFTVLDQGRCHKSLAFAMATVLEARKCLASGRRINTQPDMGPGHEVHACDALPVQLTHIPNVVPNSLRSTEGVTQIKVALLQGGPVAGSMGVTRELLRYTSGILDPTALPHATRPASTTSLVILGWGQAESVSFWIVQLSWGRDWGESGTARVRLGVDAWGIESNGVHWGVGVTPSALSRCSRRCQNAATLDNDCSCRCGGLWRGASCDVCPLATTTSPPTHCGHGTPDTARCVCVCPRGTWGTRCQHAYLVEPDVVHVDAKSPAVFSWSLPPSSPLTVGSYLALDNADKPMHTSHTGDYVAAVPLCGSPEAWSELAPHCAATGSVSLPHVPPGRYSLYVLAFLGQTVSGRPLGWDIDVALSTPCGHVVVVSELNAHSLSSAKTWLTTRPPLPDHTPSPEMERAVAAAMQLRLNAAAPVAASLSTYTLSSLNLLSPHATPIWTDMQPPSLSFATPNNSFIEHRHLRLVSSPSNWSELPVDRPVLHHSSGQLQLSHRDMTTMTTFDQDANTRLLMMLSTGKILASLSPLRICSAQLKPTALVGDETEVTLYLSFSVEPKHAATVGDLVSLFRDGAPPWAPVLVAHTATSQHSAQSSGTLSLVLRNGEQGAAYGARYTARFHSDRQSATLAVTVFRWSFPAASGGGGCGIHLLTRHPTRCVFRNSCSLSFGFVTASVHCDSKQVRTLKMAGETDFTLHDCRKCQLT